MAEYKVEVTTGNLTKSGTLDLIFVTLFGSEGESAPIHLNVLGVISGSVSCTLHSILFLKNKKSIKTIGQFDIQFTFRCFGETCGYSFGYRFVIFTFILDSHLHRQDKIFFGEVVAGQSDKKGPTSLWWRVVLLQNSGEDSRGSRNSFPLL